MTATSATDGAVSVGLEPDQERLIALYQKEVLPRLGA
jgi:hypothetical protein